MSTRARNSFLILLGAILVAVDQTAKYLVYTKHYGGFLLRLRPVFSLLIFPNADFAFSLKVPLFLTYLIYGLLLAALLIWFYRTGPKTFRMQIGLVLILAGAFSNIFDRIYLGYVRDFIYVFWGNIFNLADLYILVGIALMLF